MPTPDENVCDYVGARRNHVVVLCTREAWVGVGELKGATDRVRIQG